jgi:hypothetical protein
MLRKRCSSSAPSTTWTWMTRTILQAMIPPAKHSSHLGQKKKMMRVLTFSPGTRTRLIAIWKRNALIWQPSRGVDRLSWKIFKNVFSIMPTEAVVHAAAWARMAHTTITTKVGGNPIATVARPAFTMLLGRALKNEWTNEWMNGAHPSLQTVYENFSYTLHVSIFLVSNKKSRIREVTCKTWVVGNLFLL